MPSSPETGKKKRERKYNTMKRLCIAAVVAAFAFAFTGCEKNDTTKADVEKASNELGKSLDKAKANVEKAAKDLGNSLDSAAKDLSNKLKGK